LHAQGVASSLYSAAPEARRHPESRDSIYDWRSTTMEQGAVTLVRNIAAAGCLPLVDPSGEILQTICEEHFLTEDSHKCVSVPTIATGVFRCVVAGSGVGYRTKASFESEKVTDVYGPSIGQCVTISDVQTVKGTRFLRGTAGWLPMHDQSGTLRLFEKLTIEHFLSDNLSYCPNSTVSLEDQAKLHTLPKALDRILLQKEQDRHAHTKAEAFAVECAAAEATRLGDRHLIILPLPSLSRLQL